MINYENLFELSAFNVAIIFLVVGVVCWLGYKLLSEKAARKVSSFQKKFNRIDVSNTVT